MKKELLDFGPWKLLRALRDWEPESAAGQEVPRVQWAYFKRQQERMRYLDYLRWGFRVGSGAVEGACKACSYGHVVVDRVRQSGMRWKLATAEPVMHLRAALHTQPHLDLRDSAAIKQAITAGPRGASAVFMFHSAHVKVKN